jgi:hypothetical protein
VLPQLSFAEHRSLIALKAASCRSQAFYLFVKRVNFSIEPGQLRFWHIGAAQLIECLTDGEFSHFSHIKDSSMMWKTGGVERTPKTDSHGALMR